MFLQKEGFESASANLNKCNLHDWQSFGKPAPTSSRRTDPLVVRGKGKGKKGMTGEKGGKRDEEWVEDDGTGRGRVRRRDRAMVG